MKDQRFKLELGWTDMAHIVDVDTGQGYTDSLYSTLKSMGKLSLWRKIKEGLFKKEERKCWICGAEKTQLNAHEFWEYYPGGKSLIGIHHICRKCHMLQHSDKFCLLEEEAEAEINHLEFICKDRASEEELNRDIKKMLHERGERRVSKKRLNEWKEYKNYYRRW